MAKKNVYERICDSFELQTGAIPDRDNLIQAVKQTISIEDAKFYFLVPAFGDIRKEKLIKKALRHGYSQEKIHQHLQKLIQEAFLEKHYKDSSLSIARVFCAFVAENQVRKKKGTALGKRYAKYWMDLSKVSTYNLPSKTPYVRVLAAEETLPGQEVTTRIEINQPIEDTRETVPYDFVTEMIQNTQRIALAECYCRLSMEMAGEPCEHEKETCFLFNESATALIEIGVAREVGVEEALAIVKRCEAAGLVHNISNCKDEVTFMCNCCPCCCPIMGTLQKGITNVGAPSRFIVQIDESVCQVCGTCVDVCYVSALSLEVDGLALDLERCIGCGLCVTRCPEGALSMVLRDEPPEMYPTNDKLWSKITREALFGKVKSIFSRK